jgi:transposase-like protein
MHTMTEKKGKSGTIDVKALLAGDEEFVRALMRTALQEVLEVEMAEALGVEKGERTPGRLGYRSGYYGRTLVTRIGKLELRVPQDRAGRFSTERHHATDLWRRTLRRRSQKDGFTWDRMTRLVDDWLPQPRILHPIFERYQRSERALVAALAEMYVQGVSTRKVKAITEELCGHSFFGLVDQRDQSAIG